VFEAECNYSFLYDHNQLILGQISDHKCGGRHKASTLNAQTLGLKKSPPISFANTLKKKLNILQRALTSGQRRREGKKIALEQSTYLEKETGA
jgi:hypothetical protein